MSNLNILLGYDSGRFVLKLPGLVVNQGRNPFEYEFTLCAHYSQVELSPKPVLLGNLPDDSHTPVFVYEFAEGVVHSDLSRFGTSELSLLKTAKSKLQETPAPFVPIYKEPSEYLEYLVERVTRYDSQFPDLTSDVKRGVDDIANVFPQVGQLVSNCDWTQTIMHGDLRPDNIVFHDEGLVFLDWSECCRAEELLDYAYLSTEPADVHSNHMSLFPERVNDRRKLALNILSLMASTTWTSQRLIQIELGLVETNLSGNRLKKALLTYFDDKFRQLQSLATF
ncbi:MAG: aminoglycoside phosphotransferase family protein, partial [Candidatus Hodarchaeota archaeon]